MIIDRTYYITYCQPDQPALRQQVLICFLKTVVNCSNQSSNCRFRETMLFNYYYKDSAGFA